MKKGGSKSKLGRCLGAPMRALSRACDLYVRGMSGCAHLVPTEAVAVGRGFGGRSSATTMHLRVSSDRGEDLVRAALKQRRLAADVVAVKKGALSQQEAPAVPARKRGAAMGTISEDAPCEFVADGADALKPPAPRRRGAAVDGLAARGAPRWLWRHQGGERGLRTLSVMHAIRPARQYNLASRRP